MTYLVMECHPAYAIVLDQAGRVIKVANMGYEVGQKVDYVMEQQNRTPVLRMKLAATVIAACLCLAVMGGGTYGAFLMPYGTVQLTINPDVVMSVSYMDRVVGLKGLNEDGMRLIDRVSYKGKRADEMTQTLAERAVDMGYLTDGGTVTVRMAGKSSRWKQKRELEISTGLRRQFDGRMTVEIKVEDAEGTEAGGDGNRNGSGIERGSVPMHQTDAAPSPAKHPTGPDWPAAAPAEPGEHGRGDGRWRDDDDDDGDHDDDDHDNDDLDDNYDGEDRKDDQDEDREDDQDDDREDDQDDDHDDDRDDDHDDKDRGDERRSDDEDGREREVYGSDISDDDDDEDEDRDDHRGFEDRDEDDWDEHDRDEDDDRRDEDENDDRDRERDIDD